MTAPRKPYRVYVEEDLKKIQTRAMTLYALSDPPTPWPLAWERDRKRCERRAARELWEEGALHLDPSEPYYESA